MMNSWKSRHHLEEELNQLDSILNSTFDNELGFKRAILLTELDRKEEAKNAYLSLLNYNPTHFGILSNLGTLLMKMGYKAAAQTTYREAIKHHPSNPDGHVNLANLLTENEEIEAARQHYQLALDLAPDHPEAHQGLAYLLAETGDEENALLHQTMGYKNHSVRTLPYKGDGEPLLLLVLAPPGGGAVPIQRYLDDRIFQITILFPEFYDPTTPLPPHQLIFNAIGDADICRPALEAAVALLKKTTAPVINHPAAVLKTSRLDNAARLSTIKNVITPKMQKLSREELLKADLSFPLLLRSPGFHTGRHFIRVETKENLADVIADLPGKNLLAIEYIDTRNDDGKIRKYRVMFIDGEIYPVHKAVAHDWKVHYFTADMAENAEHRAEDEAFLKDMKRVLGEPAMKALTQIRDTLGLDYAGIDFGLGPNGEVIIFEANATMIVVFSAAEEKWAFRHKPIQNIVDAIHRLFMKQTISMPTALAHKLATFQ